MRLVSAIAIPLLIFAAGCSKKEPLPESMKVNEVTQPSSVEQAKEAGDDFLKGKDLTLYKHVNEIPQSCLHAFGAADFDANAELLEPPEDGNHAKSDKSLTPKSKRLIFAGGNERTCFVYFRKGSSVPTYQLQIFHFGPPPTISYHGVDSDHIYTDLPSLRKGVMKNAFMRMTGPDKL